MTEDPQRSTLGEQFADAVERVTPGVVTVHGRRRLPGTGIVLSVDDDGAVIVTASHVVEREDNLAIHLASGTSNGTADGTKIPATLLGRDLSRDLAVLRAGSGSLSPISDRPQVPRVGTLVMAVGRPWAATPQATLGVVNAVGQIHSRRAGGIQLIHTDATMLPGFSGGPLIDGAGNVAGINTSGLLRMANITIPIGQVRAVSADILAYGHVRSGWIGVTVQPVTLPAHARGETEEGESGLLISGIAADSPAAKAGLLLGDILVAVAGVPLGDATDLKHALGSEQIGQALEFGILRGGSRQAISISPIERPDPAS